MHSLAQKLWAHTWTYVNGYVHVINSMQPNIIYYDAKTTHSVYWGGLMLNVISIGSVQQSGLLYVELITATPLT